jgi:site-specific DNA recombinase
MRNGNGRRGPAAEEPKRNPVIHCAIYTRKSTDEGLQQDFNSLDAQREAGEAFIASQRHTGWRLVPEHFDDGGFTGGNMERPALKRLLEAIEAKRVNCVVVYKVDRLSRSLLDFARMMELFDRSGTSFVSVTQNFNTTDSMGRLTLNNPRCQRCFGPRRPFVDGRRYVPMTVATLIPEPASCSASQYQWAMN